MSNIIAWIDGKLNRIHRVQVEECSYARARELEAIEDTLLEVKEKILEIRREGL